MDNDTQYLSQEKKEALERERKELKEQKIPGLAKRIDEARQMGDLSENAEYHQAREDMSWAQSRLQEITAVLDSAEIVHASSSKKSNGAIGVGSIVLVEVKGAEREYVIVGGQEANPAMGKISNESPLGQALLGQEKGDTVEVKTPSGVQYYRIVSVG